MSARKRRLDIEHKPSRVLLSELLPYELPVTFTNSGFYEFLKKNTLTVDDKYLRFVSKSRNSSHNATTELFLNILFGPNVTARRVAAQRHGRCRMEYSVSRQDIGSSVPFTYRIRHKGSETRSLSIPHPSSQVAATGFYDKYSAAILYYTSLSSFSIRRPSRVTRYTLTRDSIFDQKRISDASSNDVEVTTEESTHLRSYFVYDDFNNIQKFYSSDEYMRAEKRFGHLVHLDIAKCFDSVYTHSLPWAVYGKEAVKSNLNAHDKIFGDQFDRLIREMNDNETHGILIGPELSRIFAEIILQRIDTETQSSLSAIGFEHNKDYRIYRYVDDYFIFMNRYEDRDVLVRHLESAMAPYRFHLNYAKELHHETPFMSDMSIAKSKIRLDLERGLRLSVNESNAFNFYEFASSSKRLVEGYKTVLSSSGLGPYELTNFVLAEVERLLERNLEGIEIQDVNVEDIVPVNDFVSRDRNRRQIRRMLIAALEFCFFVYSGSSRVSASIKLVRIITLLRKFVREAQLPQIMVDELDDLVHRELLSQLRRTPLSSEASIEGLYLLTALGDLPQHYQLRTAVLAESLGISFVEGSYVVPSWFNVLIISEVLRYIKDDSEYQDLRTAIQKWTLMKVQDLRSGNRRAAEEPLLVLNCLACPYLSKEFKAELLDLYGVQSSQTVKNISSAAQKWFTGWGPVDLHDALQRKRFEEVY